MSFKQNLLAHVEAFFSGAEALFVTFTSSLAHSIATNGGPLLVKFATEAVVAEAQNLIPGAQKKENAFSTIAANLTAAGIPVVANAINGAIEAAVAALPTAAAPPADTPVAGV